MIFRKYSAWKEAAFLFGLSRFIILLLWLPCITIIPLITPQKYIVSKACTTISTLVPCFLLSWGHWDSVHYVEIAHSGYTMLSNTVYFPFFPFLIRAVGWLFGGSITADYAAGLIVANSCFYFSLVLLYSLVAEDFNYRVARYTLIYLAFAPYGLFFFIGYTESLFLLLTLALFCLLRQGKALDCWLAGLCGFLAALTRPTGILLIVPFMVIFVQNIDMHTISDNKTSMRETIRCFMHNNRHYLFHVLLPMMLVLAGLLIYLFYQQITFGNAWIFVAQEGLVWHHSTSFPWTGMVHAIQEIVVQGPYFVGDTSDVLLTLIPLLALLIGWRRLPLHYSLFSLTTMLFVLCEPRQYEPLLSVPRYFMVIFPISLLFGLWSQDRRLAWHLLIPCVLLFIMHITQYAIYSWAT